MRLSPDHKLEAAISLEVRATRNTRRKKSCCNSLDKAGLSLLSATTLQRPVPIKLFNNEASAGLSGVIYR